MLILPAGFIWLQGQIELNVICIAMEIYSALKKYYQKEANI